MKILKIKIGEYFDGVKANPVFLSAFQKESKKGETYYEARIPIFVANVEDKKDKKEA